MSDKKPRQNRRGLLLSEAGLVRINRVRRRLELERANGTRLSLEQIAFETGLSTKTLSRVFGREVPVDRRTIELLFDQLGLALEAEDIIRPAARPLGSGAALPRYRTALFGREAELSRLSDLARDRMMLTITGSGGVGKTRLAVEWARRSEASYAQIAFLDLSLLTDEKTVRGGINFALGDSTEDSDDVLLVLDGCEHLVESVAAAANDLLNRMPRLSILTTSREPLAINGEGVIRLAPLSVPDYSADLRAGTALLSPAFAMFVERARSFDDSFSLGEDGVPLVAEIVRRLDGVPLALELAAARSTTMSLGELLASLRDHLDALSDGPRAGLARHRSARALIDWSFALLRSDERPLFARLSAFMGTFDAQAVLAVADVSTELRTVSDMLSALVRKSLLVLSASSTTRYRMLETIRQYAAEKLAEGRDDAVVRQRHALHYIELAERHRESIAGIQPDSLSLTIDVPNFREALKWSTQNGNVFLAAALTAKLITFWEARGESIEAEHWLRASLKEDTALVSTPILARLHEGLARVLLSRDTIDECVAEAKKALLDYDDAADEVGQRRARMLLGQAALAAGKIDVAKSQFRETLYEARAVGDARALSVSLNTLGAIAIHHEGEFDVATPLLVESFNASSSSGLIIEALNALTNLSDCAFLQEQFTNGLMYARTGFVQAEKANNANAMADFALQSVAHSLRSGGLTAAQEDAASALDALKDAPYRLTTVRRLRKIASALIAQEAPERASLLLGATDAYQRRGEALASAALGKDQHEMRKKLEVPLTPWESHALYARGALLPIVEGLAQALLVET